MTLTKRLSIVVFLVLTALLRPSSASEMDSKLSVWSDLFHQITGGTFLGGQKGVRFLAYDVLALPQSSVTLEAELASAKSFRSIPNVEIGFFLHNQLLDSAYTDSQGKAAITWLPPNPGDYTILAQILAPPGDSDKPDMIQAAPVVILVMVRDPNTPFVVIDLDHTLVGSPFQNVLAGKASPMGDSVSVAHLIAKDYSIIYLTHRPEVMSGTSRAWLNEHDYPSGVLLNSTLTQVVLGSGKYKTDRLAELKRSFPNIQIGIGDKVSDAEAYLKNGLTAYLIPHYDADEADDTRDMAKEIRNLARYPKLQVVASWQQIQTGIFNRKKFPPIPFAEQLEAQAASLEDDD